MRCDEVQPLRGPYLDSELDARTTLEIEQHLKSCPECARLFAEEQELDARLRAGLHRGPKTTALWKEIERSLAATAPATVRPHTSPGHSGPVGWPASLSAFGREVQLGWRRARWAWSGLAAVWVVILALNFTAREAEPPIVAGKRLPSASEVFLAVKQKQLLMAELTFTSESTPAGRPKAAPPSPRSDRHSETLNA